MYSLRFLHTLFAELEDNLSGWFGKKKKSRQLISGIRKNLQRLRHQEDEQEAKVTESYTDARAEEGQAGGAINLHGFQLSGNSVESTSTRTAIQINYEQRAAKINDLQVALPQMKKQIWDFLKLSSTVKSIFLQIDDFYHLAHADQPNVMDYLHRLCKDLPLYFKVATLRHSSTLYADRNGQPIGAQERHDYQPINIDFSFTDFKKTIRQNRQIMEKFAEMADISGKEFGQLFRGEGFERLHYGRRGSAARLPIAIC